MSTSQAKIVASNLRADELIMDIRGGGRDPRYYCLPPFRGREGDAPKKKSKGYAFYLVSQGHLVGIFDDWLEAKASVSGFPDNSYGGYHTVEDCIDAWQQLCRWGLHPHAVDPEQSKLERPPVSSQSTTRSPRKATAAPSPVKREGAPARVGVVDLQRLSQPSARTSPSPSPRKATRLNFAIRGQGVVSSSAERTEERYLELQSLGEEPDLLVTRSLQAAASFALDEEEPGSS
ncbi:hypothetical protein B0H14DRAFT_3482935 [Mycena olivaceomarginata]|nr:hypothetical protein B0H14DRAFT_3482935 [Mycena olivaceomarginata]